MALARWASNPEVDHLIGRKLSQKYRFAEGAASQQRALAFDPGYQPGQLQLCQDWLRLGEEAEGWKLAAEIFGKDGYNVVAYNLITLRDRLAGFRTLREMDSSCGWMDAKPTCTVSGSGVATTGSQVIMRKVWRTLSQPVIVEIFPQRKEFAVRTFGLPGRGGSWAFASDG